MDNDDNDVDRRLYGDRGVQITCLQIVVGAVGVCAVGGGTQSRAR